MKLNGYELVCESERSPHARGLRSGELRTKHGATNLSNHDKRVKQQSLARAKLLDTASASKRKNNQKGFDAGINKVLIKNPKIRPQVINKPVETVEDAVKSHMVPHGPKIVGLSTKGKIAVGAGLTALGLGTAAYLRHKRKQKQEEKT